MPNPGCGLKDAVLERGRNAVAILIFFSIHGEYPPREETSPAHQIPLLPTNSRRIRIW